MAAVPDDRICLESDMNTFRGIDRLMMQACEVIAGAKGWSVEETMRRTHANAQRFFERSTFTPASSASSSSVSPSPVKTAPFLVEE